MASHSRNRLAETNRTRTTIGIVVSALIAAPLVLGGLAAPIAALDDLSPTAVMKTEGDMCPELTRIKYPWLRCRANEYGGPTLVLPSQPPPLPCNLRLANGDCAASPEVWQLDMPVIGPGY